MLHFQNVVSSKIVSFQTYYILAEYTTLEEAMKSLKKDEENFRKKYRNSKWYKLEYPFAFATIEI